MIIIQFVILFLLCSVGFTMESDWVDKASFPMSFTPENFYGEDAVEMVEIFNEPSDPYIQFLEAEAEKLWEQENEKEAQRKYFERLFWSCIYGPLTILSQLLSEHAKEDPEDTYWQLQGIFERHFGLFIGAPGHLLHDLMLAIDSSLLPHTVKEALYNVIFYYHPHFSKEFLDAHLIVNGCVYVKSVEPDVKRSFFWPRIVDCAISHY